VIKNYKRCNVWGRQIFGKFVNTDFKEVNHAVFGSVKKDTSDTMKVVETCFTPARIRKMINKLVIEGGQPLTLGLMSVLPVAVIKDVFKEETDWLTKNCKTLHIDTLKQKVAKLCLEELNRAIYEKKER
jgi:hypothetical protein